MLDHYALLYEDTQGYVTGVVSFVREGQMAGEPVLVAVPGSRIDLLRAGLDGARDAVSYADMTSLGANPQRIIPAIRRFTLAHQGQRTRFVGEPIWPGRSRAEVAEATRHEALINAAFACDAMAILCPYDAAGLRPEVLAAAWQTHPQMTGRGHTVRSSSYSAMSVATAIAEQRPPVPPPDAALLLFSAANLPGLRAWMKDHAVRAGLELYRAEDLMLAGYELASNTIMHTSAASGTCRLWREDARVVCEVADQGRITDPLAGRHVVPATAQGGHGLQVIGELCDLVQLRSGDWGTCVRLHMSTAERA